MSKMPDFQNISLRLGTFFNPSSPIQRENLFQGRTKQVREVVDAINQSGKHVIMYGEAGVGKTSLGQILKTKLRSIDVVPIVSPLVNCDSSDDFTSMWTKMFDQIREEYADAAELFPAKEDTEPAAFMVVDTPPLLTPSDVRKQIAPLAKHGIVYVIFDEFDKLIGDDARRLMADTIKLFSDRNVEVTIVLIGVAESVTSLIEDHRSIERCLAQIHMPRMPFKELTEIVHKGLAAVNMTIEDEAIDEIAGLSRGLPHYTHLLALNASRCALDDKKLKVAKSHVGTALASAISQTTESIRHKYDEATHSTKKNTLHCQVLLACALAECDEFGYFQPGGVSEALYEIENREFSTDRFMSHLKKFCDNNVLYRSGGKYRWRYRFANPLMQPFVIMKGIQTKMIRQDQLTFSDKKYSLFRKRPT